MKLSNDARVVAYTDTAEMIPWRLGDLKNAYMKNKLGYKILFLELKGKNKYFKLLYHPTQGFKFVEHDPRKEDNKYE